MSVQPSDGRNLTPRNPDDGRRTRGVLLLIAAAGIVFAALLAGWWYARFGRSSGTITEDQYRRGLPIQASVNNEQLVVLTASADAANNLREVHRVYVVTKAVERPLGESSGLPGARVTRNVPLASLNGGTATLDNVRVRYEVWDGMPGTGRKLFEGEKVAPITSKGEGDRHGE